MMYNFSFFDMNLLLAGVLLAMTAQTSRVTTDEMPTTRLRYCQHNYSVLICESVRPFVVHCPPTICLRLAAPTASPLLQQRRKTRILH